MFENEQVSVSCSFSLVLYLLFVLSIFNVLNFILIHFIVIYFIFFKKKENNKSISNRKGFEAMGCIFYKYICILLKHIFINIKIKEFLVSLTVGIFGKQNLRES